MSSPSDFHKNAMAEVKKLICGLKLAGVTQDEIVVRRQWATRQGDGTWVPHRGITIHAEKEKQDPGTNRSEDIGYGIGVTMFIPPSHAASSLGNVTEWRRLIRRRFINQRLQITAPVNAHICINTVEHGDFAKDFDYHTYELSTLLIRVWTRETRS